MTITDVQVPAQTPPKHKRPLRKVLGVLVAVGAAAVLAVAIGTSVGNSPATHPSQPAVTQPVQTTSIQEQERTWMLGPGGQALTAIGTDLGQIATDASNVDQAALLSDAQQLQKDVATAMAAPANPDPEIAQHLSAAYVYMQNAAVSMIQGIQNQDATAIETATTNMNKADKEILAATNRVNALTS